MSNTETTNPVDDLDLTKMSNEERISAAMKAIEAAGTDKEGNSILSVRQAARSFQVPRTTLASRINGVCTLSEAHKHLKVLSDAQEDVLVTWLKASI
jgi:hypothetical protein